MSRKVVINPDICNGKPTLEGTRMAVQSILEYLGAGDTPDEIVEEFPFLTTQDIMECMNFASKCMGNNFIIKETV